MEKRLHISIVLILSFYFLLNFLSITHKTITYDESRHLKYGLQILQLNSDRGTEDSKMPFSAFNAIPMKLSQLSAKNPLFNSATPYLRTLLTARLVTILFAIILAVYVYRWSSALYGPPAGIFSLLLYVLSPNLIAHARLITTDLYAALMITVACYYYWVFLNDKQLKNGVISAATLGISQLAKYTAAYLYPIFIITFCISHFSDIKSIFSGRPSKPIFKKVTLFSKYVILYILINISIINIGFLFNNTFTPLKDYKFNSRMFNALKSYPVINSFPMPFPEPFILGLDRVKFHDTTGLSYGNIYLNGELRDRKGWQFSGFKGYFFYCMFYKMPIAVLIYIFLTAIRFFKPENHRLWQKNEIFIFVPVVFYMLYFNFYFNSNIGIRYITVIFPLIYIFCGSLIKSSEQFSNKCKLVYAGLMIYLFVSLISYFPHFLSYFNEFIWDRKQAYKVLADSNIDWGQNFWYLDQFRKRHPEFIIEPKEPVSGKIIVGVNNLLGITDPERYRWLREKYEPVGHIAYSFLIFDISAQSLDKQLKDSQKNLDQNLDQETRK